VEKDVISMGYFSPNFPDSLAMEKGGPFSEPPLLAMVHAPAGAGGGGGGGGGVPAAAVGW
jgi:hypothetical protein